MDKDSGEQEVNTKNKNKRVGAKPMASEAYKNFFLILLVLAILGSVGSLVWAVMRQTQIEVSKAQGPIDLSRQTCIKKRTHLPTPKPSMNLDQELDSLIKDTDSLSEVDKDLQEPDVDLLVDF